MSEKGFIERLTTNSDQEAIRFAFYNSLMFALGSLCLLALFAVYKMMSMFVNALLWATLIGTMLFPLKRAIGNIFNRWLNKLDDEDTPFLIGIIFLPYNAVSYLADQLIYYITRREGLIACGVLLLFKLISYGVFLFCVRLFGRFYDMVDSIILFCTKKWVFPIMVLYLAAYIGWIFVQDEQRINKKFARMVSVPLWIFALCFTASFFGFFRVFILVASAVLLSLIASGYISAEQVGKKDILGEKEKSGLSDLGEEDGQKVDESASRIDKVVTGDFYIQVVFVLCSLSFASRHDIVFAFIVVIGVLGVFRKIGSAILVETGVMDVLSKTYASVNAGLSRVAHATFASPLRNFFKFLFKSDQMLRESLRVMIDDFSTLFVMALLAFGSLFLIIFIIIHLHNEAVLLAKLTSNVVARQNDWLIFAKNYTESQMNQYDLDFDQYIEEGYEKGREWLAMNARSLVATDDQNRADLLEEETKKLVDSVYGMWKEWNSVQSYGKSDEPWLDQLKKLTNFSALKEEITKIVQDNIETILNIAKSIWSVLSMNIALISSFLLAVFSVIIGFGLDILHFVIEIIVFLTSLYYMLASSSDEWLPLKWISGVMPHISAGNVQKSFNKDEIINSIKDAINGVFVLSAKMAIFYGLYTYFLHVLFDLHIVFIPSILASIFAAIPIMAPHLVCFIGAIDLYVARGESAAALLFVLASFAPKLFADAVFYSELKGSHPYVTGLAIVGGMYWLGFQGAIIGPIILCIMIVLINVFASFAKA